MNPVNYKSIQETLQGLGWAQVQALDSSSRALTPTSGLSEGLQLSNPLTAPQITGNETSLGSLPTNVNSVTDTTQNGFFNNVNFDRINQGASLLNGVLGGYANSDTSYTGSTARTANNISGLASNVASAIPGSFSAITSLGGSLGTILGGSKNRVKGTGSAITEGVSTGLSFLGPAGIVAGTGLNLINGLGLQGRANTLTDNTQDIASGYSGTVGNISSTINNYSGKKAGTFDFGFKKKANRRLREAERLQNLTLDITRENNLAKSSTYGQELSSQNYNKYLGQTGTTGLRIGKRGMKIESLEEARKILKNSKPIVESKIEQEIEKFADGGKMNVIADGAFHSRKNHLTDVHDEFQEVTHKGIPVVALKEGGEILQTAEIEGGELILTKDVTSKIEELYSSGSEEAMIEAGKLIAEQLINNTDDKTNKLLNDEDSNKG